MIESYGTEIVKNMNTIIVLMGGVIPDRQPTMQMDILLRMGIIIELIETGGGGNGGGLPDAPTDGKLYGRKSALWQEAASYPNLLAVGPGMENFNLENNTVYFIQPTVNSFSIGNILNENEWAIIYFTSSDPATSPVFPATTRFLEGSQPIEPLAFYEVMILGSCVSFSKFV